MRRAVASSVFIHCAAALLTASVTVRADVSPLLVEDLRQAQADFERAQESLAGEPERAKQFFLAAAQRYSGVTAAGVANGRLEYNIGNCYLQAGDVGRAILHYLRAKRFIPGDPLLADNLSLARSRCLLSLPPARGGQWLQSLFFWHYQASESTRVKLGIGAYLAFWALLAIRNFRAPRGVTILTLGVGLVTLAIGGSLAYDQWSQRRAAGAVVTDLDVVVYKGPGTTYQRQFEQPLQPGVEVVIREKRGSWWLVELPDGESGWIHESHAEMISPAFSVVPALTAG